MELEFKQCSQCGEVLEVTKNFYLRKKSKPGWYQNKCIECKKKTDKKYSKSQKSKIEAEIEVEAEINAEKRINEARKEIVKKRTGMSVKEALAILGLEKELTQEEYKRIFKQLAAKLHPDKGGRPEDFIRAHQAYQTLLISL